MDSRYQPRAEVRQGTDRVNIRQPPRVPTGDFEKEPLKYIALALTHLRGVMERLPVMLEDNSRPVDEYQVQTLTGLSESLLTLQPNWETGEIIRSVIVTGPPATGFTLQLGDRIWTTLLTNAQGFMILAPVWLILSRTDTRQLSSSTAGNWGLELMGHADTRAELV